MGKRRRRGIWIAVAAVAVAALIAVILLRYVFVVRSVRIIGDVSASDEEVVRTARIDFGSSILMVDAEAVRRRVDATGTICLEELRIRYPNAVELTVRERKRSAMLLNMGKIRILDEAGYVVESMDEVPDTDLIYISGMRALDCATGAQLRAADGQVEAYCTVMGAIDAQSAGIYVSELDLSDPKALRIITRTGITVELGDTASMEDKIAWMKGAVADLERRGEGGGTLDVRSGSKADYSAPGAAQS